MKKWGHLFSFYRPFLKCMSIIYLYIIYLFIYMHLKGLVTHSQKIVLFTVLWLTVLRNFVKFLLSQHLFLIFSGILLNFCWVSIFFDILISWTVAQTSINHIIFWKTVMRYFSCIYVNCCSRLTFLPQVNTKLARMHFFLRTITQEGNRETRQMSLFFLVYFFHSNCL